MVFELGSRAQSAGYGLASFETIGSTNAEALSRIREGERQPGWLVTDQQTGGRGRRERRWISPKGNLAASVIEFIDVPIAAAVTLGFAAGLAVEAALRRVSAEALARVGISPFQLKWPNDVVAGGGKLAGILIETAATPEGLAVVTGLGVNVVSSPEGTPYPATSLRALGVNTDASELFAALSDSWADFFTLWNAGRGFADIRALWLERAAGVGGLIRVQNDGTLIEGTFESIDDAGGLVLLHGGRRVVISAGDVYLGSAMSSGAA